MRRRDRRFLHRSRERVKLKTCDLRSRLWSRRAICARLETSRRGDAQRGPPATSKPLQGRAADVPARPPSDTPRTSANEPSHRSRDQRSRPQTAADHQVQGLLRGLLLPPESPLRAGRGQALPDFSAGVRGPQGTAAAELRFSPGAHTLSLGLPATALRLRHFPPMRDRSTDRCA